jgi:hypothetical protein
LLTPLADGILSTRTYLSMIGARLMADQDPPLAEAAARKGNPELHL